MIVWEADISCTSCKGTGLYQGFAEKDGAAVVCYHCDGSGKEHVKYKFEEFTARKEKKGVKRVFKTAAGYGVSSTNVTTPEGIEIKFEDGGCTYADWKNGIDPLPIRTLHCPLEHYQQGTKEGEWLKDKGPCRELLMNFIPDCSRKNRKVCWQLLNDGKFKKGGM